MYCYNCQQLISIESVDPLHLRLQQNKTSKEMKIKKSQPCANCKGLKRTGVARNRIREQTGQLQYKISQQHERGRTRMKERGKGGIRGKIIIGDKKKTKGRLQVTLLLKYSCLQIFEQKRDCSQSRGKAARGKR